MISKKPTANKFYKYAGNIVKIKKIVKAKNKIYLEQLSDKTVIDIPYEQSEILIMSVSKVTVEEFSKII